jgi:GNAT superfamily N-acetyltransferase
MPEAVSLFSCAEAVSPARESMGTMSASLQANDALTVQRVSSSAEPAFDELLRIYTASIAVSERKSAEQLAKMVAQPEYYFLAAMRGAVVVGFAVAVELRGTDAALLEYMAVAESERGQGVGARLFHATAALPQLADRFLLIEVDSACEEAEDHAERVRRKAFYARLGARELDGVRYRMPRVAEAEPPEMELMVFRADLPASIASTRVQRWIECVYAQVYGVKDSARTESMLEKAGEQIRLIPDRG